MKFSLSSIAARYAKLLPHGERVRPYRDWVKVIVAAAFLFVASAVWSYVLFLDVSAGANLEASPQSSALVNVAGIETVRTMFEMRAGEQAHYRTDYRFVDPSK